MLDLAKVIDAVEKFINEYDFEADTYNFNEWKKLAWEEISKEAGVSSDTCQEHWTQLRNEYIQYLRDQENDTSEMESWPYAKKMTFLQPFISLAENPQPPIGSIKSESIELSDIDLEERQNELDIKQEIEEENMSGAEEDPDDPTFEVEVEPSVPPLTNGIAHLDVEVEPAAPSRARRANRRPPVREESEGDDSGDYNTPEI